METTETVSAPLKQRLIKIYEVDEGDRTLIYVGRTAKTLEKYVEDIKTFEKVEQVIKSPVQQHMYGKGLEKFEFESEGVEYETIREAEAAKAAVIERDKPTMNKNLKKETKEKPTNVVNTKYIRVNGKFLVFKVDPVKEAEKEEKRKARQKIKEEKDTKKQKRLEAKQKREEEAQQKVEEKRKKTEEKQKIIEENRKKIEEKQKVTGDPHKKKEGKQKITEEVSKYQNDIMTKFINDMIISESK